MEPAIAPVVVFARAGESQAKSPPARKTVSKSPRWSLLAGAAALFVAVVSLFVLSLAERERPTVQAAPKMAPDEMGRLSSELAAARAELDQVRQDLKAAEERLAAEKEAAETLKPKVETLERQLDSQRSALQASVDQRKALETAIRRKETALAGAQEDLKASEEARAMAVRRHEQAAASLERLGRRLSALSEEMERLRKMNDDAVTSGREARVELARLRARTAAMALDIQQAYLTAAAGGEVGMKARQIAARRTRMLQRCAELRRAMTKEQAKQLLDRLEVMLTRLDLLDTNDLDAVETFRGLFGRAGLEGQIDELLSSGLIQSAVRVWLFEAKLILGTPGVRRVG